MAQLAYGLLWLYVFTLPWENVLLIPGLGTLSRYVGILAALATVAYVLTSGRLRLHWVHLSGLGFVLLAAMSYFWSIAPQDTLERILQYGLLWMFFWALFVVLEDDTAVRRILGAYVLGAYVAAGNTIYNFLTGSEVVYQRYAAANFDPGDLSFVLSIGIPLAWYLALRDEKDPLVWLYRLYPLLALGTVFLTAARAGLLGVAVGLLFVVLTFPRASWKLKALVGVLAALALSLIPSLIPPESFSRLATLFDEVSSGTLNDRTNIWAAGWQVFGERPVLGTGAGTFGATLESHPWFRQWVAPHNLFVAIAAEMGVVGLAGLLLLLGGVVACFLSMPPLERLLWGSAFLILMLACMAQNWEWRKQTWFVLGMVLAHYSALRPCPSSSPLRRPI
ncbi:MAG: O-antigen ligase family protein [Meiothermus sp.]|uniref:O-antigen ligase family protein n=1 Tax=Meiothermus sp. TaxID=1955249 RepID=UPI0026023678|nr:O-antigen ligase family protein [Meiothermus sp.]MCS7058377.1 O-antigen ligase family protein [Meiothermus sp.]MCX7740312.1 O-antigen ligase family protein [Meiothermus sp.]MDW8481710.1 O-antigen ligase family protein [Meiothermus sp.]